MLTNIFLIRHSEKMHLPHKRTAPDLADRILPLSWNGERKAHGLLNMEELRNADAVYCSPFARTISTLRYIIETDHLMPILDDRLRELEFGNPPCKSNGGTPTMPFLQGAPGRSSFQSRQWDDRDLAAESGESLNQCASRIREAVFEFAAAHPGKKILVGSHGAALCAFMSIYMDEINDDYTLNLPQPAVFRLQINEHIVTDARRLQLPVSACDLVSD